MKNVLLGLAGVLAMLLLISYLLPRQAFVYRTKKIKAPASQIQPYITSLPNWQKWSPWNGRDPEMKVTYGPVMEGQGASWSWKSKSEGDGGMTLTLVRPDTVAALLDFREQGTALSGFSFKPDGNGTLVTWTMTCDMGNNPIARYMGQCMDSMVGDDYDQGLENLKALSERGTASAQ